MGRRVKLIPADDAIAASRSRSPGPDPPPASASWPASAGRECSQAASGRSDRVTSSGGFGIRYGYSLPNAESIRLAGGVPGLRRAGAPGRGAGRRGCGPAGGAETPGPRRPAGSSCALPKMTALRSPRRAASVSCASSAASGTPSRTRSTGPGRSASDGGPPPADLGISRVDRVDGRRGGAGVDLGQHPLAERARSARRADHGDAAGLQHRNQGGVRAGSRAGHPAVPGVVARPAFVPGAPRDIRSESAVMPAWIACAAAGTGGRPSCPRWRP